MARDGWRGLGEIRSISIAPCFPCDLLSLPSGGLTKRPTSVYSLGIDPGLHNGGSLAFLSAYFGVKSNC